VRYSIRTVTPANEIDPVIDLAEAKRHLLVELDDFDATIAELAATAQGHIERYTSQILTPRDMEIVADRFPSPDFEIPRDPITAISSIAYLDASGVAAELVEEDWRWSEYVPNLVRPAIQTIWPAAYREAGSVRIAFEAGYEVGLAPASLIGAVKLVLTVLYDNRGATDADILTKGVRDLCEPYRRRSI
jgi:uncharacterized phiE125 gp8 family phage protein